jgi:hypothetical protein
MPVLGKGKPSEVDYIQRRARKHSRYKLGSYKLGRGNRVRRSGIPDSVISERARKYNKAVRANPFRQALAAAVVAPDGGLRLRLRGLETIAQVAAAAATAAVRAADPYVTERIISTD